MLHYILTPLVRTTNEFYLWLYLKSKARTLIVEFYWPMGHKLVQHIISESDYYRFYKSEVQRSKARGHIEWNTIINIVYPLTQSIDIDQRCTTGTTFKVRCRIVHFGGEKSKSWHTRNLKKLKWLHNFTVHCDGIQNVTNTANYL